MTTSFRTDSDTAFAKAAVANLGDRPLVLTGEGGGEPVILPAHVAALVREILHNLANGRPVQLEPASDEMTPMEAAAYLNVSRPHVVKLLDEGKIPFRMVGTHHRIPTADLVAYKRITRARQEQAMADLVHLSEDMGLYDTDGPPPPKATYRGKSVSSR